MKRILLISIALFSSLVLYSVKTEEKNDIKKAEVRDVKNRPPAEFVDFISEKIRLKGDAIPFDNYQDWLNDVSKNVPNVRRVDMFTSQINPKRYNDIKSKMVAQWIEYESGELKISGAMLVPKYYDKKRKLPVLIYNRGGNVQTPLTRVYLVKYLAEFAANGYIVLASNYRGARHSEGADEFGGADVQDVLQLVNLVETIPQANPEKVGMMGASRGTMMTLQVLRNDHKNIKAAILLAAVTDLFQTAKDRPDMEANIFRRYIPDYDKNRDVSLEHRSAIYWADEISAKTPILMLHGTSDVRVGISQSRKLAEKFKLLGRNYKLIEYEYGNHALTFYQEQVNEAVLNWLDKHL